MACNGEDDGEEVKVQIPDLDQEAGAAAPQGQAAKGEPAADPPPGEVRNNQIPRFNREDEEEVNVQIPDLDQEAGAAAPQGQAAKEEPAADPPPGGSSVKLGKVPGLAYPSVRFRDAYHPAVLLYGVGICLSELSSVLMPSGTWAGKEPPPLQIGPTYSAERRHCFGLAVFQLTYVYMISAGIVAPIRVVAIGTVLGFVTMTLEIHFMGASSFAYILGIIFFPCWSFKFCEQPCFAMIYIWVICVLMYCYLEVLFYFKSILSLMPNALFTGALGPIFASAFSNLTTLGTFIVEKYARPGIAPTLVYLTMAAQLAVCDLFLILGMMGSAGKPWQLAVNWVFSVAGDIMYRTMTLQALVCKIRGTPLMVDASNDLFLRLRFSATYFVPFYLVMMTAFQAMAGIAWAQQPEPWVGLIVYLSAVVLSDVFITIAHRRHHPLPGEGFLATVSRLASQPRAHWPTNQPDTPISDNLWKPSAIASTFACATDELLSSMSVTQLVSGFAVVSVYGHFGPCGIYYHLDNC